jgi:hypothetical protein
MKSSCCQPIAINSDYGRIGKIAWVNKSGEPMDALLNACWGSIYWFAWSKLHQDYFAEKAFPLLSFSAKSFISKITHYSRTAPTK